MTLKDIKDDGAGMDFIMKSIPEAYGINDFENCYTTTAEFTANNKELLDGGVTDAEKRRIFFSTAFSATNMVEWKYENASQTSITEDKSFTDEYRKNTFSEALVGLEQLVKSPTEDERVEAIRLYDEAKLIMGNGWDIGRINYLVGEDDASKKDVKRSMSSIDYVNSVAEAASYLETITAKFQAGEISRSDLTMTLQIMTISILDRQLAIHKGIISRGWYTNDHDASELSYDDVKDQVMASTIALVRSMGNGLKALETGKSVQQSRGVVDMSLKLVELAKLIASDSYSLADMKGVPTIAQPMSAEELGLMVGALVKNSQAVLAKYTPERLALAPQVPTQLASLSADFNSSFGTTYASLQNAENMGDRLSSLLLAVEAKKWQWSEEDKTSFKELYATAMASSSEEAKKEFYKTITERTLVDTEKERKLVPFSQTGQTVNFAKSITIEDENGVRTETTEHPVMHYTEVREIYSHLPFDFYVDVTFSIEGMGVIADNYRETHRILIVANKYAIATYTANISVASENTNFKPDVQMKIANNGLIMQTAEKGDSTTGVQKPNSK